MDNNISSDSAAGSAASASLSKWLAARSAAATETVTLEADQTLFVQGAAPRAFYLLQEGQLEVSVTTADGRDLIVDVLTPPAVVGEMGFVTGLPRSASVTARAASTLLRFDAGASERLSADHPDLHGALTHTSSHRWERVHLARALQRLLGDALDTPLLFALQDQVTWHALAKGDVLCRQGDASDGMYLIISGRLRFTVTGADGSEHVVGGAETGDTVGEFSLISPDVRSATVIATRETHVVKFTPALFNELVDDYPAMLRAVTRSIVERRQRALGMRPPATRVNATVTLLPAQDGVDLMPFAAQLVAALQKHGTVRLLDADRLDAAIGRAGMAQTPLEHASAGAISTWFGRQERQFDFIVFLPDATWTPWTARCINQSDRLLVVGRAVDSPVPGALERSLAEKTPPPPLHLVLWHPAGTDHPTGTAAWLDQRAVSGHSHVRDGDAAHFDRLARHISGNTIGLVLSGGGARGFAHLGVMRAMEEMNIPIDYVGGTSFGALIGASRARTQTTAEMGALARRYATSKQLFDRTLPIVSLYASHKLNRIVEQMYSDWRIEDLWLPYFAIGADLLNARQVVYRTGLVRDAVRRSVALPGVFVPLNDDGTLVVDGGLMNNFPVDVMRDLAQSERIIGVAIGHLEGRRLDYDLSAGLSGWRVLWSRLNPFTPSMNVPGIANTFVRSMMVNNSQREAENAALVDLLINPVPRGFGLLDFDASEAITAVGYEAAQAPLATWLARQSDLVAPSGAA